MRVYVCGPMAGKPNLNRAAFDKAAAAIRARGDEPVIPHDLAPYKHDGECGVVYGHKGDHPHDGGCYVRGDIAVMVMCDSVYRLKGWENSLGAGIETSIANLLAIPIEDEP